jgi:hypothetical protein
MSFKEINARTHGAAVTLITTLLTIAPTLNAQPPQGRGGQAEPAPSGPMANEKYKNIQVLTSGRPMPINGKDTTVVTGRAGLVTEQFYFDSASGLLLRRVVTTRTPLGQLREQIDYADYRPSGDVKIPFEIEITTWNALDTFTIADAKVNVPLDDARFARPK